MTRDDLVKRIRDSLGTLDHFTADPALIAVLCDAADRIEALMAAQAWRPIESAPRDGTYIIVAKPGMPAWEARMGRRGWYCLRFGFSKVHSPTHWMPLPQPPEEAK